MIAPRGAGDPVTPLGDTVAAFDFDGTLTRGGSVVGFLVSVRGRWPVLGALVADSPKLVRAALFGGPAADRSKEALFVRVLAGVPAAEVDRAGVSFAREHLRRRIRPEVRARLEWHRRQGHRVVIVSASPECYVGPAGEELGVDGVLATRLAVDADGNLTGRYEGANCRGAEKYTRTMAWLEASGPRAGSDRPTLWAYGNSRGDLRLLGAADHGVDAGRLGRFGRLRRFPSLAALDRHRADARAPG